MILWCLLKANRICIDMLLYVICAVYLQYICIPRDPPRLRVNFHARLKLAHPCCMLVKRRLISVLRLSYNMTVVNNNTTHLLIHLPLSPAHLTLEKIYQMTLSDSLSLVSNPAARRILEEHMLVSHDPLRQHLRDASAPPRALGSGPPRPSVRSLGASQWQRHLPRRAR